jgi:nucleotide-binding universal stress UspA family protein
MANIRRILIPIDFSEASFEAIRVAKMFVRPFSEVTMLHVITPSNSLSDSSHGAEPTGNGFDAESVETALDILRRLRRTKLKAVQIVDLEVVVAKSASEAICKSANSHSTDLVVLASRKATGLRDFAVGTVAREVLRKTSCRVLVAHPKREISIGSRGIKTYRMPFPSRESDLAEVAHK